MGMGSDDGIIIVPNRCRMGDWGDIYLKKREGREEGGGQLNVVNVKVLIEALVIWVAREKRSTESGHEWM